MTNIKEKSILIVDDDAAVLRALKKVLSGEGAVVESASWAGLRYIMNKAMRDANTMALAGALIWLVGCASPMKVAVLEPIGPGPSRRVQSAGDGGLGPIGGRKPIKLPNSTQTPVHAR
jgi:hypothetical protein